MAEYQLPASDAQVFVSDLALGKFFEGIARQSGQPKAVANWIINNLRAKLTETAEQQKTELAATGAAAESNANRALDELKFPPTAILELVKLVEQGTISSSAAQTVFSEMYDTGDAPAAIVERRGLAQISDTGAIETLCDDAIAAHPRSVEDYRHGKAAALNFLKGQVMKLSKGKANPSVVGRLLEEKLKA
jgi:aspartyl-tRNA(Asn)/glutamyl-tRNA(Gln) amidotransferase subunit B